MPEWIEILRQRIGALGLEPSREAEILAELASHHEELFEEWRISGLSEEEATARVLDEVSDWRKLRREIRSAELEEIPMNQRTRSIWLPGLMTGTLAWGLFWLLETSGVRPRIFWLDHAPLMFSLPWTLSLPIIGALGAYTSRGQGGGAGDRLLAGLFPTVTLAILSLVGFASVQIIGRSAVPLFHIAVNLLGWMIIPGMALLVGVTPFVLARRETSSPSAKILSHLESRRADSRAPPQP